MIQIDSKALLSPHVGTVQNVVLLALANVELQEIIADSTLVHCDLIFIKIK